MTKAQRLKAFWERIDIFVLFACVPLLAAAAGAGVMNWINQTERMKLESRFPIARAEVRAECEREFQGKIGDLEQLTKQQADAFGKLSKQMDDTHEVVQYTLRYLGDRARIADARSATVLKQTREAAQAAAAAQQTTAQVEQKVAVVATKADEAASTAQAVSKKLDTAVRPALPARPWIGTSH